MSKLRSLSTAFWSDPFIEDLTPSQKLLFIYLITNDKTNMLGIYESSIRKMSFETGIKKEDISNALKAFEKVRKVKYINNYVVLVNYMKHQNFNTNMKKSAIDVYNNLPNELKISGLNVNKNNPLEGFESLLNHFGMVRKVEVEYEVETKIEEEKYSDEIKNFTHSILKHFPIEPKKIEDWYKVTDELVRIDKYNYDSIRLIVETFTADGHFWKANFQSYSKLRKLNKDKIRFAEYFKNILIAEKNGINKGNNTKQQGATLDEIQNTFNKHFNS